MKPNDAPRAEASFAAVICAAGSSRRMGGVKKEYLPFPARPGLSVLGASVDVFASCARVGSIVIVLPAGDEMPSSGRAAKAGLPPELLAGAEERVFFVTGGPTRRASVHNALAFLAPRKPSHVLIHDGARPWVTAALAERVMDAALEFGAVIPALPLTETPKELEPAPDRGVSFVRRHLRRQSLCGAQTPQAFSFPPLLEAHEKAALKEAREGFEYTDDAEVWGEFAGSVAVIAGESENRKITWPGDIEAAAEARPDFSHGRKSVQRTGLGRDLHRLAGGRRFLLGGVELPFEKGEEGHSDGDVLAHAVIDALLGAAGLGDIGELYPPLDPAWKDSDSLELLKAAWDRVRKDNWHLVNLDCVVSCERPKILPYRDAIRRSLAAALGVDSALIFVKGKTNEGLGPVGRGEAVEALAVCLLEKRGGRE